MHTTIAPAAADIKQGRSQALCAAGGALIAALAWTVEVPLLGIHLNFRFGLCRKSGVARLLGWLSYLTQLGHQVHLRQPRP